jgi:hypothetical protein
MKTDNLTKQEAIQSMKEGKRVTHFFFSDNEWMTMDGDKIVTEEGYRHDANEFWSYRTGSQWDSGYSILKTEQEEVKHTPLPWERGRRYKNKEGGCSIGISGNGWDDFARIVVRMNGADFDETEGVANLKFILEACNNYYSLKSQLQQLQEENSYLNHWKTDAEKEIIKLTTAASSLHEEKSKSDSEVKTLREALEVVVNGYEGDGMERMFTRDHLFYHKCKQALQSKGESGLDTKE